MQSTNHAWLTKATLLLVSTLTVMAGATIAPSLPEMQAQFTEVENAGLWVRLVLTLPALFIVIGSPLAGLVVDRLGRKPLLVGAALLYGLAGSSGYLLDSLFAILVGRAFLGLAVAGIMVTALTLISDYYVGQARATFMGLQAAFMGLGGVLFLTLGGFLADLNWRFPFLIYLFAWLLLPLIVLTLREPQRAGVTVSAAAADQHAAAPVPLNLLILVYGVAVLTQIVFYMIPVQLPFYLKELANAAASESGLAIALSTLFSAFASIIYGRLKQRLEFLPILVLTLGLMGAGYILIGLSTSYVSILFSLAIAGLGLGLLLPNLNLWVSASVPEQIRGRALGGLTTFFFLGQFLSPLVSQPLGQWLGLGSTYALAGAALLVLGLILMVLQRQVIALVLGSRAS